jgi:hypothetical protein
LCRRFALAPFIVVLFFLTLFRESFNTYRARSRSRLRRGGTCAGESLYQKVMGALGVFRPGMAPGRFTSGGEYRLSDGALRIDNRKPDNGRRDEVKNTGAQ